MSATATRKYGAAQGPDGQQLKVPVFAKQCHPQEFRRTAESPATESCADMKVVQQMLDHEPATMLPDLHGRLFPDRLDVLADAHSARLGVRV